MKSGKLRDERIDRAYNALKEKKITSSEFVSLADLIDKKYSNLKDWYKDFYPSDELGDELRDINIVALYSEFMHGGDIYKLMGVGDSIVRERVFAEFSDRFNRPYEDIYNDWINN